MTKDDDIAVDFSKITRLFKGKKKEHETAPEHHSEHHTSHEEASIDLKSIANFFVKNRTLFLVLIPLIISIMVRMYPSTLPITDDWATKTVESYYKDQITNQVTQQYPNLPDANKQTLVEQQYADFYAKNKAQIQQQIQTTSQNFKSAFELDNGDVYMPDIDPYTYLREAQNYLNHGYIGDEIRNGSMYDNHMVAPKGSPMGFDPHPIVLAYLYKIMHAFNSKMTLMQSSTYFPVIFSALAVIPIFFIGRMFAGNVGGFFAALMLAVNGAFISRTSWGHADTDAYNILFAVYFIWFVFLAIKSTDFKKSMIYSVVAGLTIGLFSWFWPGWWYVFDFVAGMLVLYGAYLIFVENKIKLNELFKNQATKQYLIVALAIILASGIFVSLFSSPSAFLSAAYQPLGFTTIKEASNANLWPNVYTTVAELNSASFDSIMNSVGGPIFFYASLIGILLLFLNKTEGKRNYMQYVILLILWYIGIIYASTKGIRFTMMLVPPISLAIGAVIGIFYRKAITYLEKTGVSPKITATVFIALMLLIFMPYTKGITLALKNDIPIMNDAWWNSLTKIKQESQPNAIINSWWDFGHHFKYVADRAVTFDGASQNSPMAHWIGKVLLTNDEDEAIGILRMLDCGSNDAFDYLNAIKNDTHLVVNMLYDIVKMTKSQAESYLLSQNITEKDAQNVLTKTHCDAPEDYFITSDDMVAKAGVWAHFGAWNFSKAEIWVDMKNMDQTQGIAYLESRGYSEADAQSMYYEVKSLATETDANSWIASWPGYASSEVSCVNSNESLICGGGIKINPVTYETVVSTQNGLQKPYSIVYQADGKLNEIKFADGKLAYSVILINSGNQTGAILSSPELAESMFTRLFFMEGYATDHFELFSKERQITGGMIYVWKVKWP